MTAEILSIGDELLIGQIVNTNAAWIGERLSELGIAVRRITTVGDDHRTVLEAFSDAWNASDLVLATGGLGPTHDDVTRNVVVEFFHAPLVLSEEVLSDVERFLSQRGRPLTAANRDQAMVPAGAAVIRNAQGTAPGYHFAKGERHFFVMPGVPYEMQAMMEEYVLPLLRTLSRSTRIVITLRTTGIPESALSELLGDLPARFPRVSVAYLPSPLGVSLRLSASDDDGERARALVAEARAFIESSAGEFIYGTDEQTLESVVRDMLAERGCTVAVAESCTGGLIADRLTNVPGSSEVFERGVVAYSNASKTDLLGVDPSLFPAHGAVSRQVALAMASGVRARAGTTYGISTTGIAGPSGATPGKPVGLVWIGFASAEHAEAHAFLFGEGRLRVKQRAAQAALDMLRRSMLGLPLRPADVHEHAINRPAP
ncbi:MAG: competence/damage-inducible protein A [Bacteroidota bacterium]|nr:competence/damage-inducible protein A [Bacteroidota bacterium]